MSHPSRPVILSAAPVGFTPDGAVDYDASHRILEFVAGSGTDGAFVIGTTGEFPSLSREERRELARLSVEALPGKQVVVHAGASSAFEVGQLIEDARDAGAAAVAAVTPYYLHASDDAILEFYRDVSSKAQGLDVYTYLFTARTGNRVGTKLLSRIAELPNLVGAKISGESLDVIADYRDALPDHFQLFTGGDRDIASVTSRGVDGVVSGVASVFPRPFVDIADAVARGDSLEADRLQEAVDDVVDVVLGDPERIKVGLALQGITAGTSRMALDPVTPAVRAELERAVEAYA